MKAGSLVTCYNDDAQAHTVGAVDGSWDSGKMLNGFSFGRIFDTPGTSEFQCIIHSPMKGRVIVA